MAGAGMQRAGEEEAAGAEAPLGGDGGSDGGVWGL